jgi:hypothetical protein
MAKVFSIHYLELKDYADAAEFEQVVIDEFEKLPHWEGWQGWITKGERGDGVGKYAMIWEIESLESRNKATPSLGVVTAEGEAWLAQAQPVFNKISRDLC